MSYHSATECLRQYSKLPDQNVLEEEEGSCVRVLDLTVTEPLGFALCTWSTEVGGGPAASRGLWVLLGLSLPRLLPSELVLCRRPRQGRV